MSYKAPTVDHNLITINDIKQLTAYCLTNIHNEEVYYLRNDAKIRAINSSKSYEEFRDIVDAAHLQPITNFDKKNTKTKMRLWNSASKD